MRKETDFLVLFRHCWLTFALESGGKGKVMIMTRREPMNPTPNTPREESPVSCMRRIHSKAHPGYPHRRCRTVQEDVVRMVVTEGAERIREIIEWGHVSIVMRRATTTSRGRWS